MASQPILASDDDLTFLPMFRSEQRYVTPDHKARAKRAVLDLIGSARATIHVGAYGFTDEDVIGALIAAHGRGVAVRLLLDHTQAEGRPERAQLDRLFRGGFVLGDHPDASCLLIGTSESRGQIRHYKIIIADSEIVESGSLNYGANAWDQDNTVVIECDAAAALWHLAQWQRAWAWVAEHDARYNVPGASSPTESKP